MSRIHPSNVQHIHHKATPHDYSLVAANTRLLFCKPFHLSCNTVSGTCTCTVLTIRLWRPFQFKHPRNVHLIECVQPLNKYMKYSIVTITPWWYRIQNTEILQSPKSLRVSTCIMLLQIRGEVHTHTDTHLCQSGLSSAFLLIYFRQKVYISLTILDGDSVHLVNL